MSRDVKSALKELNDRVLGRQGVAGTAVTERDGEACLVVYLADEHARSGVPDRVKGVRVVTEVTGPFRRQ